MANNKVKELHQPIENYISPQTKPFYQQSETFPNPISLYKDGDNRYFAASKNGDLVLNSQLIDSLVGHLASQNYLTSKDLGNIYNITRDPAFFHYAFNNTQTSSRDNPTHYGNDKPGKAEEYINGEKPLPGREDLQKRTSDIQGVAHYINELRTFDAKREATSKFIANNKDLTYDDVDEDFIGALADDRVKDFAVKTLGDAPSRYYERKGGGGGAREGAGRPKGS